MPYHFRLPRFSSLLTTVIVLALLISSLALPQRSAHAATTYTVTSTADTGGVCPDATKCTLRQNPIHLEQHLFIILLGAPSFNSTVSRSIQTLSITTSNWING